ncbi:MAG TPA: response regulator transcription factor [Spirochaetota bacterium]|jgi:two-component system phosphate regulon response regulator PhoB/two-component system alkaline phosphatase synthesis response regulator PhoP|nr:MAG: Alkaline phosphatase synthesis transcriptional regulatory protein PhoP [Spirochaetes bacterium ADurb.Bin133]HNZ27925.1 response regulator transcription factor [Spirochaetota bacterium]HPY87569.1 response regulator transcription factor [Spirochaetota bacterium]
MNELIAIVDDEKDIVDLITLNAEKNGYKTIKFYDGKSLLDRLELYSSGKNQTRPDAIILDIMLPDMDGFEICKIIKSDKYLKSIPIIMLTAKQEESDKLIGLEIGADDYVTKPFSIKELLARIKALLRRYTDYSNDSGKILKIGSILTIDMDKYEVYDENNKKIDLTTTEFNILTTMAKKKGWVFSRDKLLSSLWGDEKDVLDRTIDVHIKHLRTKLGSAGSIIKNVRGVGYKIEE